MQQVTGSLLEFLTINYQLSLTYRWKYLINVTVEDRRFIQQLATVDIQQFFQAFIYYIIDIKKKTVIGNITFPELVMELDYLPNSWYGYSTNPPMLKTACRGIIQLGAQLSGYEIN